MDRRSGSKGNPKLDYCDFSKRGAGIGGEGMPGGWRSQVEKSRIGLSIDHHANKPTPVYPDTYDGRRIRCRSTGQVLDSMRGT